MFYCLIRPIDGSGTTLSSWEVTSIGLLASFH